MGGELLASAGQMAGNAIGGKIKDQITKSPMDYIKEAYSRTPQMQALDIYNKWSDQRTKAKAPQNIGGELPQTGMVGKAEGPGVTDLMVSLAQMMNKQRR